MEAQRIKALLKKVGKKTGILTGVIGSTADLDRYGDSVNQESWQLENYKQNPVILWAHNASFSEDRPPIGKATRVEVIEGKLEFDIEFDLADEFAANIFRKYAEGFLNAFSVGFIPHQRAYGDDGRTILLDNELLELSCVPVPANPKALNDLRTLSFAAFTDWDTYLSSDPKKKEEKKPEIKSLGDEDVDKIATKVVSILNSKGIVGVEKDAKGDDEVETPNSATPKSPQLGAPPEFVAVVREATKQMQGLLAKYNRSQKGN